MPKSVLGKLPDHASASIYISCVDTVAARFEIAEIIQEISYGRFYHNQPKYWMDFGNSKNTGQVLLSTVEIKQQKSEQYETVAQLPLVTEEFGDLLRQSEITDDTPSCSLAEALEKQGLFINSTLAQMGYSLLMNLFRDGMTQNREFFLNLKDFRFQPIKI